MNYTVSSVIEKAKSHYFEQKGPAFVAAVVPLLIAMVINMVLAFMGTGIIITILTYVVNGGASYMSVNMILRLIRNQPIDFETALAPGDRLIKFIAYVVLFALMQLILSEILTSLFVSDASIDALLTAALEGSIDASAIRSLTSELALVVGLQVIIMTFIEIKFFLTQYLIVDGMGFVDAFTHSFTQTKGHVWNIIKTYLYILLLSFVFGIIMFIFLLIPLLNIIAMIGLIVLIVGFFMPFVTILFATLYLQISGKEYSSPQSRTVLEPQEEDGFDF